MLHICGSMTNDAAFHPPTAAYNNVYYVCGYIFFKLGVPKRKYFAFEKQEK